VTCLAAECAFVASLRSRSSAPVLSGAELSRFVMFCSIAENGFASPTPYLIVDSISFDLTKNIGGANHGRH
jgi:hypothetical protein